MPHFWSGKPFFTKFPEYFLLFIKNKDLKSLGAFRLITRAGITAMRRGMNIDDLGQIQSDTDENCQFLGLVKFSAAPQSFRRKAEHAHCPATSLPAPPSSFRQTRARQHPNRPHRHSPQPLRHSGAGPPAWMHAYRT